MLNKRTDKKLLLLDGSTHRFLHIDHVFAWKKSDSFKKINKILADFLIFLNRFCQHLRLLKRKILFFTDLVIILVIKTAILTKCLSFIWRERIFNQNKDNKIFLHLNSRWCKDDVTCYLSRCKIGKKQKRQPLLLSQHFCHFMIPFKYVILKKVAHGIFAEVLWKVALG